MKRENQIDKTDQIDQMNETNQIDLQLQAGLAHRLPMASTLGETP